MLRLLLVSAAIGLMAAACGSETSAEAPPTTATVASSTTVTTREPPTTSSAADQGTDPDLTARCGAVELPVAGSPVLPDTPLDDDAQAALASVWDVAAGEAAFFDGYEWFIAERSLERLVLFGMSLLAVPPGAPPYADAVFGSEGGQWTPQGWGQCRIRVDAPGFGNAAWILDAEPSADAQELFVQINERECASGQPPAGRRIVPVLLWGDHAVTITVLVEPVAGGATCPSNPWFPLVVDLGETLGERVLLDGSTIPPLERPWPPTPSSIDSLGMEE